MENTYTILIVLACVLLSVGIFYFYKKKKEEFDGIGKSFGQFHFPEQCCKSKNCFPGMYAGNNFTSNNCSCQCSKCTKKSKSNHQLENPMDPRNTSGMINSATNQPNSTDCYPKNHNKI